VPARTGSRRRRLWICRFAWTTQTRCPHTHSRRKSSSRKLLDLKDKGRRDHTLTSAILGPRSGVHFRSSSPTVNSNSALKTKHQFCKPDPRPCLRPTPSYPAHLHLAARANREFGFNRIVAHLDLF